MHLTGKETLSIGCGCAARIGFHQSHEGLLYAFGLCAARPINDGRNQPCNRLATDGPSTQDLEPGTVNLSFC